MNVQIRAKRILSRLGSYHPIEAVGSDFLYLREQAFRQGAIPIGVYINTQGSGDTILLSDLGLISDLEGTKAFIAYRDIERVDVVAGKTRVEAATDEKSDADGLLLTLLNSTSIVIPVRDGNQQYRDVFEFGRFISRAVEDVKKSRV